MKLVSWNVNGIRACIKNGFLDTLKNIDADIICLQETKAHPDQVDLVLEEYPHHFWNSAEKKGYSGTAIFSKKKPLNEAYGIGIKEHDTEGRVITLEFDKYYLVNTYVPNSGRGLVRIDYRQEWDKAMLAYLKKLEKKKPVIWCGDLNVAHKEIDLKNPKSNYNKTAGYTEWEIKGMDNYLASGLVDSFRHFYPDKKDAYSWWSYMFNARAKNVGWRIDYFLISSSFMKNVKDAGIMPQITGSDHCPVWISL